MKPLWPKASTTVLEQTVYYFHGKSWIEEEHS